MKDTIKQADLDQVAAYARDIKSYHSKSQDFHVIPVLIPTMAVGKSQNFDGIYACSPDRLVQLITPWISDKREIELKEWLSGEYIPLPSLVSAAQKIYKNEELPHIRKANSAGIPEAVEALLELTSYAKANGKRILVLVTGVPGSGKTLLGLDYVHKVYNGSEYKSIFLSGNGPLVEVLQHSLKNKTFVGPLRNFVLEYGIHQRGIPAENVIVFDEAQRAWDNNQVKEKHRINKSEPDLIIEIADSIPDWTILLGLVGEGQEINTGEEAGITQWEKAINHSSEAWEVICPPKLESIFERNCEVKTFDAFDLNVSLRSHLADDVSNWVAALLNEDIEAARDLAMLVQSQGFHMYITRDINRGKNYCRYLYEGSPTKRYGLVCSSKANNLKKNGIDNSFETTRRLRVGPWYNEPSEHPDSCCQFLHVATEFSCQGLELDLPIVCWGDDLHWQDDRWQTSQRSTRLINPHQIRLNSYRVLLTRGRDGFIVYLPDDRNLDETFKLLLSAGLNKL